MADNQPDKPDQPPEDAALRRHVDDMMASSEGDATPAVSANASSAKPPEKLTTAPKLPSAPPLVIRLADEKTPETKPEPTTEEAPTDAIPSELPAGPQLDDQKTDEAVDDIAAKESDTVLAVEDARAARKANKAEKPGWKTRLNALFKNKWTWFGVALLLIVIFALPPTRYKILGLVLKKPVSITVLDSKTGTPVSSAVVRLAGVTAKTDANGHAHLKAALGKHTLQVGKKYYEALSTNYFVGFKSPAQLVSEKLVATGRLVPLTVLNDITGKPLAGVEVKLKGTTAKTDSKGQTSIALPTTATSYAATLTLNGYNPTPISVQVTDQVVKANIFQLAPAGHIYFLSNASGTIDIVKANLDGTDRKTVVTGTGHEDPSNTSLLASRDWRYLVLEASRDGGKPALYLIDTSNDQLTEFDNSGGDLALVGWYGHNFVYDLTKSSQSNWQASREAIKSYDADHQQLNQLDQTQAEGSAASYAYQNFANFYIQNGLVVYSTQWTTFDANGGTYDTTGKSDTIRAVAPTGQNKKDYQTFPVNTTGYIQAQPYSPQAVYFAVYNNGNGSTNYYDYENQSVKTVSINNGTFAASYPTYLISPSGNQTFWTQLLDGQNALFTGDNNANSKKQIASSGTYTPYGWYSDNYLLVSKDSSQLYIMPATGLSNGRQALKITAYYKPAQTYRGYGYGYGGL